MQQHRFSAMFVMPAVLYVAIIAASPRVIGAQEPAASAPATSDPSIGEGCKLHPYVGTTPLGQLPNYFKGEEDLRAGMTCQFRIHPDLPTFTFHFPGQPDNTFGDIEISKGTSGKVIQTIENSTDPGAVAPTAIKNVLIAVDANFDGYKDLQILNNCG